MSNTPGINPLTPELETIRHSDDPAFDEANEPNTAPDPAEEPESEEDAAERIKRKTVDLA